MVGILTIVFGDRDEKAIIALGGGGFSSDGPGSALDRYVVGPPAVEQTEGLLSADC
jgi:hypothetical protein